MVKSYWWGGVGGLCDFIVTPVPIGLGFQFLTGLGLVLGLGGLDLGLGLDNYRRSQRRASPPEPGGQSRP